jgi:hypothetical protein
MNQHQCSKVLRACHHGLIFDHERHDIRRVMLQCRYQQSSRHPCVDSNCGNHSRCFQGKSTAVKILPAVLQFVKKVVEFRRSSYRLVHLQTDADFPRVTVGKNNTGLLKRFLYLKNRRKVSFYDSIILLDALKCRQANPRRSGELSLAPTQKRPPSSDLRRVSHPFGVFSILYQLTIDRQRAILAHYQVKNDRN